jgi:tetratricopeptide (TPR) repeat protein
VRAAALLMSLLVGALGGPSARADQNDARLGPLFERLKAATDAAAAKPIELEIWRIWGEVANAESRALLARGTAAMNAGDARTACAAFDLLVAREPAFAEGWNKRATLLFVIGDDVGSIADIGRTLALEPRHFGALAGLALISIRQGRPARALEIYERTLKIHPFLLGALVNIPALREQLKGDPT